MTFFVYGIHSVPAALVSLRLKELNVTHTCCKRRIELGYLQPSPVNVTTRLRGIDHQAINFVCMTREVLAETNIQLVASTDYQLENLLRHAIMFPMDGKEWSLVRREPQLSDYVKIASKPSYLNRIQDVIYKINPYDLLIKARFLVLMYLLGKAGEKELFSTLINEPKFSALHEVLQLPERHALRSAVLEYTSTKDEVAAAKRWGVETFEVLYVYKAGMSKLEAAKEEGK